MFNGIKEYIFHRVSRKAAVSATTALVAYLSTPAVVEGLAKAGITIDASKLAGAVLVLLAGLAGAAWQWFKNQKNKPAIKP